MPQNKTEEILKSLKRIERKIDRGKLTSIKQWIASFGFGLMIGAIPMLYQNIKIAFIMFAAGLIFVLLARFAGKS